MKFIFKTIKMYDSDSEFCSLDFSRISRTFSPVLLYGKRFPECTFLLSDGKVTNL